MLGCNILEGCLPWIFPESQRPAFPSGYRTIDGTIYNHETNIQITHNVMKTNKTIDRCGNAYDSPGINAIEMATNEILCASDWNDGSISDIDEHWNVIETL